MPWSAQGEYMWYGGMTSHRMVALVAVLTPLVWCSLKIEQPREQPSNPNSNFIILILLN